jgi:transforming growth factor-beta-induced protein
MKARSIVDNAVATPILSTLVSVLTMPHYKPVLTALSGKGPFTVFAPTNAAFAAAGVDTNNVAAVTKVLQYHVLAGKISSSDLQAFQAPTTLMGSMMAVRKSSAGVTINGSSKVVTADVDSTNGIVHLIDSVLMPPPSIVENAIATPSLSTLVSVLTMPAYKPILDALSGKGPFTVFAPTNDAFAAAGVDVKNVAAVTKVLQYHVMQSAVFAEQLAASQEVTMLNGAKLKIIKNDEGVHVGPAQVVAANVLSSNGVVHVINKVLMPPTSSSL